MLLPVQGWAMFVAQLCQLQLRELQLEAQLLVDPAAIQGLLQQLPQTLRQLSLHSLYAEGHEAASLSPVSTLQATAREALLPSMEERLVGRQHA